MRPLLRLIDKSGTNRVHQNVVRFFIGRFLPPEPVVEKIPLPGEATMAACPSLEICNRPPHRVSRVWKTEQCVRVVRHQKEDPAIPRRGLLPVAHGAEDRLRVPREKIRPARLRAERNKKRRIFGGNPNRSFVRELFSTDVHAATKIPQATRLADRKVGHPGGAPPPGIL